MRLEWTRDNVGKLFILRRQADDILTRIAALDAWLNEDPAPRIARIVEVWNAAAATNDTNDTND